MREWQVTGIQDIFVVVSNLWIQDTVYESEGWQGDDGDGFR